MAKSTSSLEGSDFKLVSEPRHRASHSYITHETGHVTRTSTPMFFYGPFSAVSLPKVCLFFLLQFPLTYLPLLQVTFSNGILIEETYGRVYGNLFCFVILKLFCPGSGEGAAICSPRLTVLSGNSSPNCKHGVLSYNLNSGNHLSSTCGNFLRPGLLYNSPSFPGNQFHPGLRQCVRINIFRECRSLESQINLYFLAICSHSVDAHPQTVLRQQEWGG